ncbi:MAG TPA: pyridoxamine 5'-phosphate oxidase family protein [Aliiroseovarius sp.]|nr:pyridoxamine 5'-phosphate oxidase family protein [Aliiroseovarius sp.]
MAEGEREPFADIAFTRSVKAMQSRLGSRARMERLERAGRRQAEMNDTILAFVAARRSFYLGTASAAGRPYIQHRGGPAGFVSSPDARHLEFADLAGNGQYITLGNLSENPRAFIFMMDYYTRTRVKFWGRAEVLAPDGPDRRIRFTVEAWDVNCRQHIPELVALDAVREAMTKLEERNRALEAKLVRLRGG